MKVASQLETAEETLGSRPSDAGHWQVATRAASRVWLLESARQGAGWQTNAVLEYGAHLKLRKVIRTSKRWLLLDVIT